MKKLRPELARLRPEQRMHGLTVPIVGLTGGIATGKSTVAGLFRQAGFCVIDADGLIKTIYRQAPTIDFVQSLAPECVSGEPRSIDFRKLRQAFFSDRALQQQLEQFLYSKLKTTFMETFESMGGERAHALVIYDVPLLFEKGLDQVVDVSLCVYSPRDIQKLRLIARDNISDELAEKILKEQMSIEEKKKRSRFVIENHLDSEALKLAFNQLLGQLFI